MVTRRTLLALTMLLAAHSGIAQPPARPPASPPASPPVSLQGTQVEVILFPSATAAAIYVGVEKGFYAKEGLDVRLNATPDAATLVSGLAGGAYQVAVALADNFVAYQQGQHAVPKSPDHDLAIVMGLATSSATLMARTEISSIAALRGKRIGVDAPQTGLAFVLYEMLNDAGLHEGDYDLALSGSTQKRALALTRGDIDATALTAEFAEDAAQHGMRVLAHSSSRLPSYMGMVLAVDKRWAEHNRDELRAFIRATLRATQWLVQPTNQSATAAIMSGPLKMSPSQIERSLKTLLDEHALMLDGHIDGAGFDTVLNLRARYGKPPHPMPSSAQFLDLSYLTK